MPPNGLPSPVSPTETHSLPLSPTQVKQLGGISSEKFRLLSSSTRRQGQSLLTDRA